MTWERGAKASATPKPLLDNTEKFYQQQYEEHKLVER